MKVVKQKGVENYAAKKRAFKKFDNDVRKLMTSKKTVKSLQFFGVDGVESVAAMVGTGPEVFDLVVKGLKINKDVFTICDAAIRYVKEERSQERKIAKLVDDGVVSKKLYEALDKLGIYNLEQLAGNTKKEVQEFEGVGRKSFDTLKGLMAENELLFKCERDARK